MLVLVLVLFSDAENKEHSFCSLFPFYCICFVLLEIIVILLSVIILSYKGPGGEDEAFHIEIGMKDEVIWR